MRLIKDEDVKELLLGLDSLPWEEEVDDLVRGIGTAYDVEAVVKKLNDVSTEVFGHLKVLSLDKAIEIVKRGGVK